MLNKIILIGRLTKDPELKHTASGTPVARFTLAVDRPYQKQGAEKETDFIDVVTWRGLAENCAKHLGKGRLAAVDGRLQIRSYEDNQGIRRKAAEVVADGVRFLDRSKSGSAASGSSGDGAAPNEPYDFGTEISFNDDDLPF